MITIKPSPTADSRTAQGEVTKEQLLESSKQHIEEVSQGLCFFAAKLVEAATVHDHTKIERIDSFYDAFSQKLTGDEFKAEPWCQMHYKTERHHLNDYCPDDVTLIDVLERVADITMAGLGRSGTIYSDSLDPQILQKAYENTIDLLKRNVEVTQ